MNYELPNQEKLEALEKSILATLCYFDIFDYPLTLIEVWKNLFQPPISNFQLPAASIFEVQKVLARSENLKERVECQRGFYFLKGRQELLGVRRQRWNIAQPKFKKAQRITKLLRLIPFSKAIILCNRLSYSNSLEKSDIDFFIIAQRGRIWLVRFFSVALLKLLRLQPTPQANSNKICLSFFVSENNLDLQKVTLAGEDIHFVYWLFQFVPLYEEGGIFEKLIEANQWARKFLPHIFPYQPNPQREVRPFLRVVKKFVEKMHPASFGGALERFYRYIQLKIMPAGLKEQANKDTRVVISNVMLKFHNNDRREEYRKVFEERLQAVLSPKP